MVVASALLLAMECALVEVLVVVPSELLLPRSLVAGPPPPSWLLSLHWPSSLPYQPPVGVVAASHLPLGRSVVQTLLGHALPSPGSPSASERTPAVLVHRLGTNPQPPNTAHRSSASGFYGPGLRQSVLDSTNLCKIKKRLKEVKAVLK